MLINRFKPTPPPQPTAVIPAPARPDEDRKYEIVRDRIEKLHAAFDRLEHLERTGR